MKDTIADYILAEEDFSKKVEIMYHLRRKIGISFDNTIVFKALLAKLFIETMELNVDENITVTAMMLCECKKINNAQDLKRIEAYAKESAEFIRNLGFDKEFCLICEQHNRYSNENYADRRKESDILELVDQFGGMLIDRAERIAFPIEEALALLENRNLKGFKNRYLKKFKEFIEVAKEINI